MTRRQKDPLCPLTEEELTVLTKISRVVAGIEAFENADDFPFYEHIIEVWQRAGAEMAHELGGLVE
jgi:hypothetical protein